MDIEGIRRKLKQLGYPEDPDVRQSAVWFPFLYEPSYEDDKLLSCPSFLIHKNGLPEVLLVPTELREQYISYATDKSVFSQPPPLLMVYNGQNDLDATRFVENRYEPLQILPTWSELDNLTPGCLSEERADREVLAVSDSIGRWLQSRYSDAAVKRLMSIHVQRAAIVKELIQNACDCFATEIQFEFNGDTLIFRHDGHPFMPANVHAITALNLSCKPPGAIGYKGIGFKAVYQVCRRPQISSGPFRFAFQPRTKDSVAAKQGILCPYLPVVDHTIPRASTGWTEFYLPLDKGQKETVAESLRDIEGTLLLFVAGKGLPLRRILLPDRSVELPPLQTTTSGIVSVATNGMPSYWFCIRHRFQVGEDRKSAFEDFSSSTLREDLKTPLEEEITVAAPLHQNDDGTLTPNTNYHGRFHSFMPTIDKYPYPWDINGNFLVDEQRDHLRVPADGSWNAILLDECGKALLAFLDEAIETWRNDHKFPVLSYFNIMPTWSSVSEVPQLELHFSLVKKGFYQSFQNAPRVPVISKKGLRFVTTDESMWIEHRLLPLFSRNIWRAFLPTNRKPVVPELDEQTWGDFLSGMTQGEIVFDKNSFVAKLTEKDWLTLTSVKSSSPDFIPLIGRICCYLGMLGISRLDVENAWLIPTSSREIYRPNDKPNDQPICRVLEDEFSALPAYVDKQVQIAHDGIIRFLQHDSSYFRGVFAKDLSDGMREDGRRFWSTLVETLSLSTVIDEWLNPAFADDKYDGGVPFNEIAFSGMVDWVRFLFQNRERINRRNLYKKLHIRLLSGSTCEEVWRDTKEIWLFGDCPQGRDVEQFISHTPMVAILSKKCKEWLGSPEIVHEAEMGSFFSRLGVLHSIGAFSITLGRFSPSDKEGFCNALGITLEQMPLGDINYNMCVDDYKFHEDIMSAFYDTIGDNNYIRRSLRIQAFIQLLEKAWSEGLKDKCHKRGSYHIRGARENSTIVGGISELAVILKDTEWIPLANDLSVLKRPNETCLPTERNIQSADLKTIGNYAGILLDDQDSIEFLGFADLPSEITSLDAIRSLTHNWTNREDPKSEFENLYFKLAGELGSRVSLESAKMVFSEEMLLFVPSKPPVLRRSPEVLCGAGSSFEGFLEDLADFYPKALHSVFRQLGVAGKVEENHYLRYFVSYIWKERPTINESRRQLILKTYRRLAGWAKNLTAGQGIWATEDGEAFVESLLFYGNCTGIAGWYSKNDKIIVYRDEPQIEALLAKNTQYVLESFLTQLRRTEEGLEPFLQMFGIQPASRLAARKIITSSDVKLPLPSSNFRQNLFRLTDVLRSRLTQIIEEDFRDDTQATVFFNKVENLHDVVTTAEVYQCSSLAVTYPEIMTSDDRPASCDAALDLNNSQARLFITDESCASVSPQVARELKQLLRSDTLPEQSRVPVDRVLEDVAGWLDQNPDRFESRLQEILVRHYPSFAITKVELELTGISAGGYQPNGVSSIDAEGDADGHELDGSEHVPKIVVDDSSTAEQPFILPDINSQKVTIIIRSVEDFEVYTKSLDKTRTRSK